MNRDTMNEDKWDDPQVCLLANSLHGAETVKPFHCLFLWLNQPQFKRHKYQIQCKSNTVFLSFIFFNSII